MGGKGVTPNYYARRAGIAAGRVMDKAKQYAIGSAMKQYKTITAPIREYKKYTSKAGFTGKSNATFRGKFKKPRRKNLKTKSDKYSLQGVINIRETSGTISDSDCVYLSHSTYEIELVSKTIAEAIIRKLFKMAGFDGTNPDATTTGQISKGFYELAITMQDPVGTFTLYAMQLWAGVNSTLLIRIKDICQIS